MLEDGGEQRLLAAEVPHHQRQVASEVLRMTERLTRVAMLQGRPAQAIRNAALGALRRVPAVRGRIARSPAGYG